MYSVTAWLVLQFAEVTFEPFGIPDWGMRALVVAAIAGVPIAFVLAWIIDIRPEGLIFDLPLWTAGGKRPRPPRKSDPIYALLLIASLVFGALLAVDVLVEDMADSTEASVDLEPGPPALVAPPNSIAVLAFDNFDGHEESEYFAAGLAEEILNLLAALPQLRVAARTSSFRFRDQQLDIREVASLLGVRHLLEGSVRRAGDTMRVTAQLIDGTEGFHDWSETYNRKLEDIFQIQEEIAAAVVNELSIALSIKPQQLERVRPTDDIEAYVFYLEGRGRLRASLDADVHRTAGVLFRRALEIDPAFARAYSGLCEVHLHLYSIGKNLADFHEAEAACARAAELDEGVNSEVALALGKLYRHRGLMEKAEEQLQRSIATDPKDPSAYIEMGELRGLQMRPQAAEALFMRAIDLERNYWRAHAALGMFYYRAGSYDKAVRSLEVATSLAPDVASAFTSKGAAYAMLGEPRKARQAYDESLALKPSRQAYTNMGLRYYYDGQFQDAADMQEKALEYAPDDHRVWGRLAESLRFVPGASAEAERAYEQAARHAEAVLQVNADDWDTMGLMAIYYAHLGRLAEALESADRAVQLAQRAPKSLYFQALVLQQAENDAGALDTLAEVLDKDPQYEPIIRNDPDLADYAGSERFQSMLRAANRET